MTLLSFKKSKKVRALIIYVLALIVVIAGGWYFWYNYLALDFQVIYSGVSDPIPDYMIQETGKIFFDNGVKYRVSEDKSYVFVSQIDRKKAYNLIRNKDFPGTIDVSGENVSVG